MAMGTHLPHENDMIGWTHVCLNNLIVRKYGLDTWLELKKKAGLDEDSEFEIQCYYDDTETMRIFRTAANVLGLSVDDLWEMYGEFLITWACEQGWELMLKCMANNLQEFLDNLNAMHYFIDQIAFQSEMRGPTFHCESMGENGLRLHYFSNRQGLFPIVKGLVRRTARVLFEIDVRVNVVERSQERRKSGMAEHVIFAIEPEAANRVGQKDAYKFRRGVVAHDPWITHTQMPVNMLDIIHIFPYHICFNKQLVIEHVGAHLLNEYGLKDKKLMKLSELVQLLQPSDIQLTHKNILAYLNTLFIFQVREPSKRNTVQIGSSQAYQQPLCLKGQMMSINSGNSVMFLCSPHVTTVRDILNLKLFISDMPMHDATRDLVMLNQSRNCQMELNKKVDETVKTIKKLSEKLNQKRQQTDLWTFECVPLAIADSIRQNKDVLAREFTECAILCSDLPDFAIINSICKPCEVVDIVYQLFTRFDRLIAKFQCYKFISTMDCCLIASGVPTASSIHCEAILNLAIGMIFEGHKVVVPGKNLPMRVRVGIHCGPVVAGIVMQKKPIYCVFGRTVTVATNVCDHSTAGKILVTNTIKIMVTKVLQGTFEFTTAGMVDTDCTRSITYYLEKNSKQSVYELVDVERGTEDSIDGYRELHSDNDAMDWEAARLGAAKQQLAELTTTNGSNRGSRAKDKLQSMRRKLQEKLGDQTVFVDDLTDSRHSSACSLM